jgi:hypothetical protein
MNRADFRRIARSRLREAGVLLKARCYSGGYYLSGYVIECALKACIAKQTKRYDFPSSPEDARNYYNHDLTRLLKASGLEPDFKQACKDHEALRVNWTIVKNWSEQARYEKIERQRAIDLFHAVSDAKHGILSWLQAHW